MQDPIPFKSGFVAVVGRPNVGKSTLINALVGAKVSIVTAAPQTTRNRILGIVNRSDSQVILMDTPGIHKPLSRLNEQMMAYVRQALEDRDLVLLIVDASGDFGRGDQFALELVKKYAAKSFPISALHGAGLAELMDEVIKRLPEGPQYFPADVYTDQPERFLASEIIREKIICHTRQELPYVTAVLIDQFEETDTLTRIYATIVVEKESQKPIVIGAGGQRIKRVGTDARRELEKLFPPKVFLELYVKVEPHWRDNRALVAALDYRAE